MRKVIALLLLSTTAYGQQVISLLPAGYDGTKVKYVQHEKVIKDIFNRRPFELEITVEDVTLQLTRSFVFSDDFTTNLKINQKDIPLTYRGKVKGEENSRASVTILDKDIRGSYSYRGENYFFSPEEELHNALPAMNKSFDCRAEEISQPTQVPQKITGSVNLPCIGIRLEVDKDVFDKFKTESNLTGFIVGVWNEVFYLYEREGITLYLNEVFIHKDKEMYDCNDSYDCLKMIGQTVKSGVKSDLTQLWKLSSSASGGIAWLPGICSNPPYRTSYAGIDANYQVFPNSSWTVMVVAHELGHNLGSHHTHACKWNGDNTAIDGCYTTEGNCGNPGRPSEGGTIMSYCHLTSVGINFNLGFGDQPGDVIRRTVAVMPCISDKCSAEPECIDVDIQVKYDFYPTEISWKIKDSKGDIVEDSGTHGKDLAGAFVSKQICLPKGCYTLELTDTEGDGLVSSADKCQIYGYFKLSDPYKDLVKTSSWGYIREYDICIGEESMGQCEYINFDTRNVISYTIQDRGMAITNGNEIEVKNNGWKAIRFPYKVTRNTIIEFDFYSEKEAEIHAIGLDTGIVRLNPLRSVQVFGTQRWGYQDNNNYESGWKSYRVAIGEQYYRYKKSYIGDMKYMFFLADDDKRVGGNSIFRNIRVYENGQCQTTDIVDFLWHSSRSVPVFPNPADDRINLPDGLGKGYRIHNSMGEVVASGVNDGSSIDVSHLIAGNYYIASDGKYAKIIIH